MYSIAIMVDSSKLETYDLGQHFSIWGMIYSLGLHCKYVTYKKESSRHRTVLIGFKGLNGQSLWISVGRNIQIFFATHYLISKYSAIREKERWVVSLLVIKFVEDRVCWMVGWRQDDSNENEDLVVENRRPSWSNISMPIVCVVGIGSIKTVSHKRYHVPSNLLANYFIYFI